MKIREKAGDLETNEDKGEREDRGTKEHRGEGEDWGINEDKREGGGLGDQRG